MCSHLEDIKIHQDKVASETKEVSETTGIWKELHQIYLRSAKWYLEYFTNLHKRDCLKENIKFDSNESYYNTLKSEVDNWTKEYEKVS